MRHAEAFPSLLSSEHKATTKVTNSEFSTRVQELYFQVYVGKSSTLYPPKMSLKLSYIIAAKMTGSVGEYVIVYKECWGSY